MGQRPAGAKPPAHLSKSPPVPKPGPAKDVGGGDAPVADDPTRYGDWTKKGIAVDF